MAKLSPQPWRLKDDKIIAADGRVVAVLPRASDPVQQANGHAIIAAFQALQRIDEITSWPAEGVQGETDDPLTMLMMIHFEVRSVFNRDYERRNERLP